MNGLDSKNLPVVGSKWLYTPSGMEVEVAEIIGETARCTIPGKPGQHWDGTVKYFQTGEKYKFLSAPENKAANDAAPLKGVGADGLPLVGSQWKANVNGCDDVFEVVGFNGTEASLHLIQRRGKVTLETNHSWRAKDLPTKWTFVGMAPEPEKVGSMVLPRLKKKERFDPLTYEKQMQSAEKAGNLANAKLYAAQAQSAHVSNNALLLEEKAYDERRMIHETDLNACSAPDRKCWEIRGLKSFVQYGPQLKGWFWYK